MVIITDNDTLKQFIPNHFVESEGEATFFEKLTPWLEASEDWIVREIVGDSITDIVAAQGQLYRQLAFAVAADALHSGLPSLDLVLTPNGFGVVSTGNVAPASKERVERLRESLLSSRDAQLSLALDKLLRSPDWRACEQGKHFAASLFMVPEDVAPYCSYSDFKEFRQRAVLIENQIADKAVSPELMAALRAARYISITPQQEWLTDRVMALIRDMINGDDNFRQGNAMSDIVQLIRCNPEYYPEWQGTATAALFEPPIFENEKGAAGYWF